MKKAIEMEFLFNCALHPRGYISVHDLAVKQCEVERYLKKNHPDFFIPKGAEEYVSLFINYPDMYQTSVLMNGKSMIHLRDSKERFSEEQILDSQTPKIPLEISKYIFDIFQK